MLAPCLTAMLALAAGGAERVDVEDSPLRCWPADQRQSQKDYEIALNRIPTSPSLRANHEMIAEHPHYSGTPNDLRAAERLAAEFTALGFEVEKQELWVYLAEPLDAALEIVSPVHTKLSLKEDVLAEDPYSGHRDLRFGWNAYSGNGDVTAPVVYANYGTKEDFEKLSELGVEVAGKIVIARYGGNYRGYKAKFAEAAGGAGLIIYTDPADSGFAKGLMYPEGGYATPSYIQRGSIKALDYVGDALTPFEPATKGAKRLDPDKVGLPVIPVQPVGWGAAQEILGRMNGDAVPSGWQGGLPFTYRVSSDEDLMVRLMVKQKRGLKKVYNVLGTLRGTTLRDRKVFVGCHYDAWTFGAADPLAGTMVLYECAKSFAALAERGRRPARSIVFANWAAEEFGIIGSVEWVEANGDDLMNNGVAYLNLDMAAMGPNFGSSAAPVLQKLIAEATREVQPSSSSADGGKTVFDMWVERSEDGMLPGHPRFGHLGGGSDHVGFYCHAAVPSASLGAGGAKGVSYHSNYDNLAWYRKVVGQDYEPAKMVTRVLNVVVARLAHAPLLPIDPVRYGPDVRRHLKSLAQRAGKLEFDIDLSKIEGISTRYEQQAVGVYKRVLEKLNGGELSDEKLACLNKVLFELEHHWYHEAGLPGGRSWFRNLYAATDPDSGYAAWMLPALRWAVERKQTAAAVTAGDVYHRVFTNLLNAMDQMEACID